MEIYFDEAGNSGQNLLDKNQPVFVVASINFSLDETKEILSYINTDSSEIHFNRLRKYGKYHSQILNSLNHELITSERVKVIYYDKRFALIAHIVDQLIEPVFHHRGIDLYKKGLNLTYSNSLYHFGFYEWNKDLFEIFLNLFQSMIREKTELSINTFYQSAHILNEFIEDYQKQLLEPILASRKYIVPILDAIEKYSIDLTLPSVTRLADLWNKEVDHNLNIVHDDSKQIEFWKDFIFLVSKMIGNERVEVGFDYRKMTYPLAIDSVELKSSKDVIQIQLADLIASSLSYCIKKIHIDKSTDDKFANDILASKLGNIKSYPIMPSYKVTPEDLGTEDDNGINPLDFLAQRVMDSQKLTAKKHTDK